MNHKAFKMKLKSSYIKALAVFIVSLSISCSERTDQSSDRTSEEKVSDALQKKINLDTIRLVELSKEASRATEEWMMYIALNSEIERFDNYTVLDVINNAETFNSVVDSLTETVPKRFETNAVKARLITLKTHSELLNENSSRIEPKTATIEDISAKLKLDFNNLNIQLNEVIILEDNTNANTSN